jgi:lipopolysaccharide transport system permease protein
MKKKDKITVYSPDPALKEPTTLFTEMVGDLIAARELAWRLFVRNISAKYRQTMIGYVWAILPPVLTSAIWIFLNSQKIFSFQESRVPYPLFVFTGTIIWQVFIGSVQTPIQVVKESASMLAKINFPREALIIAALLEILLNTFIQLILLSCTFVYFGIPLSAICIAALGGLMTIIMMGMMIGVILTPFAILYGDVQQGLPIIFQPLFYLTPIVYPIPESGIGSILATWNPVSPVIQFTRELLISGQIVFLGPSMVIFCITFFLLLLGWLMYRLAMPHLVERIAA